MAKQQSLAAQTGALSEGLRLPAVFSAPSEPIRARFIAPYVTFAHPRRADEWAKLVAKFGTVNEGSMYLVEQDALTYLDPMKCTWVSGFQYWAQVNPAGEVLRTSLQEMPEPFKEHIEAVLLILLQDRVVPANIQFRTTKCPAAKAMSDALADAASPDWGARSPAHKESLICTQPFMRFFAEVSLSPQRTSKSSGLTYRTTTAVVKPTGAPEWRLLKSFVEAGESTQKALDAAAERFSWRRSEVEKLASA